MSDHALNATTQDAMRAADAGQVTRYADPAALFTDLGIADAEGCRDASDQRVRDLSKALQMPETDVRFMLAIGRGETDGDVVIVDDLD